MRYLGAIGMCPIRALPTIVYFYTPFELTNKKYYPNDFCLLRRMYMTLHNLKIINMSYVLTKYYLGLRHTRKYRCIYKFTVLTHKRRR